MKKLLLFIAAFIVVSTMSNVIAAPAHAQTSVKNFSLSRDTTTKQATATNFTAEIIADANDAQKFILIVSNPFGEKLSVKVSSRSGEGYNEVLTQTAFRKRFNMSDAEDGAYTVTVENGKQSISRKIQLSTSTKVMRSIAIQ